MVRHKTPGRLTKCVKALKMYTSITETFSSEVEIHREQFPRAAETCAIRVRPCWVLFIYNSRCNLVLFSKSEILFSRKEVFSKIESVNNSIPSK